VLVITPGLGFDASGGRIGRGKGYYDQFFQSLKQNGQPFNTVAVCFSGQYFAEKGKIPMSEHDVAMDTIITP
jgi:5-formyltetrahydrofolate cyclo-ligase